MKAELVHALSAQRASIVARWDAYLRIEPVTSPLANPDTLMFGADMVLNELFALLQQPAVPPVAPLADHSCGRNPLRAFYAAAEQALLETLIQVQSGDRTALARERINALDDLRHAIQSIARRDLEGLSALCRCCRVKSGGQPMCHQENRRRGARLLAGACCESSKS